MLILAEYDLLGLRRLDALLVLALSSTAVHSLVQAHSVFYYLHLPASESDASAEDETSNVISAFLLLC